MYLHWYAAAYRVMFTFGKGGQWLQAFWHPLLDHYEHGAQALTAAAVVLTVPTSYDEATVIHFPKFQEKTVFH